MADQRIVEHMNVLDVQVQRQFMRALQLADASGLQYSHPA